MTIPASPSQLTYAGDGASVAFPITFVFDTSADIKVILTSAAGLPAELSTGFSITGGGGSTGTCTMDVAPAVGETLTLLDDPELTQVADYQANDAFPAESHEGALDRGVRQAKRLHQRVDRSIRVEDGDLADGDDLLLPIAADRANKVLGFNPAGQPIVLEPGGGADSALRTDLATAVTGDALIAVKYDASGSAAILLHDYIEDDGSLNVMGFVPTSAKSTIRDYTSNTDLNTYLQVACDAVGAGEGNAVFAPRGRYTLADGVDIVPLTTFKGCGWGTTIRCMAAANNVTWLRNALATVGGDGFIDIRDLTLSLGNPSDFYGQIGIDMRDRDPPNEHAAKCRMRDLTLENWNWRGIYLEDTWNTIIERIVFSNITNPLYASLAGQAWCIYSNTFANGCEVRGIYSSGHDAFMRAAGATVSGTLRLNGITLDPNNRTTANPSMAECVFLENIQDLDWQSVYIEGQCTGPSGTPGSDFVVRLKTCMGGSLRGGRVVGDDGGTTYSSGFFRVEGDCRNLEFGGGMNLINPVSAFFQIEAGAEDTRVSNTRFTFANAVITAADDILTRCSGDFVYEDNNFVQAIAYAATITPNWLQGGYVNVANLTGNITINAPTQASGNPGRPKRMRIVLQQDGTGGRTVSFGAGLTVHGYSNTGNSASRYCFIDIDYTGTSAIGTATAWAA